MQTGISSRPATLLPIIAQLRYSLPWLCAAALFAPLSVLLHELGHYLTARLFFTNVTLHYEWVTYSGEEDLRRLLGAGDLTAAARIYPLWQVWVSLAAGPLISYLLSGLLYLWAGRKQRPIGFGLGLVSGLRALTAFISLLGSGPVGVDEAPLAAILGVHPLWIALPGMILFTAGAIYLWRSLHRGRRLAPLLGLFGGTVTGLGVWLGSLGPRLMP